MRTIEVRKVVKYMAAERVLILGIGGMLGSAMFRFFEGRHEYTTYGTFRGGIPKQFGAPCGGKIVSNIDVEKMDDLIRLLNEAKPTTIINCVGLVKQREAAQSALVAIPLNSLFPHRLAELAGLVGARLIHISTDCVFSGQKGAYTEEDQPDCCDLYGRTKLLGEVVDSKNVTIRTSIIGHEISTSHSLVDWFLSQEGVVRGFGNAIFSGIPTNVLASVIHDYVIRNKEISGLWHLSSDPISKLELLELIKSEYKKNIKIIPDYDFKIDRSLNSEKFRNISGWKPPKWEELINLMRIFHKK